MQNIIAWENLTEAQGHGTVRTSDLGGAFFELSSWDCTAWERNAGVKRYVDCFLPSKSLERRSADGQRHASLIVTPVYHKDDWAAFSTALGGGRLLELRSHMTTAAFRWSRPVHRCHVIVQLFSFFFYFILHLKPQHIKVNRRLGHCFPPWLNCSVNKSSSSSLSC